MGREPMQIWTIQQFGEHFELTEDQDPKLEGRKIRLIHVGEYESIPDGIELISIQGERKVKGRDYIDLDTRGGYIAFGTLLEEVEVDG